jgi:hypothetical protein
VTVTETEDGMVLLDERRGRYWQLNGTAATVVRLLREGSGVDEVIALLSERHPAAAARVAGDVHALIRSLREAKVLKPDHRGKGRRDP